MIYDVLSHEKVYKGKIIDVYNDEIVLENEKVAIRETVAHIGAAAVLPIDENGNIVFVRQYRHPAKQQVLEIPAGTLEINEKPEVCAYREIEEEIGYKAEDLVLLTKMYPAIGYSTEVIYIYLAQNLILGKQNLDEDEFVTIERYSLDKSMDMIENGEIVDSKTIIAILLYKEKIRNI